MFWHRIEFEDRDVGQEVDTGESRDVGHHRTATDVEEDPVGAQDGLAVLQAVLQGDPQRVRILETGVAAKDCAAVHAVQPALHTRAVRRA